MHAYFYECLMDDGCLFLSLSVNSFYTFFTFICISVEDKEEDMEEELSTNELTRSATVMAQYSQNTFGKDCLFFLSVFLLNKIFYLIFIFAFGWLSWLDVVFSYFPIILLSQLFLTAFQVALQAL